MLSWPSSEAVPKKPSSRRRNTATCQVPGCLEDLSGLKLFFTRNRICKDHCQQESMLMNGTRQRFCQQCGRFHTLLEFDGNKRTCRSKLEKHNARRRFSRKKRAAALDTELPGALEPALLSDPSFPPQHTKPQPCQQSMLLAADQVVDHPPTAQRSSISGSTIRCNEPTPAADLLQTSPSDTDADSDNQTDSYPAHHRTVSHAHTLSRHLAPLSSWQHRRIATTTAAPDLHPATAGAPWPVAGSRHGSTPAVSYSSPRNLPDGTSDDPHMHSPRFHQGSCLSDSRETSFSSSPESPAPTPPPCGPSARDAQPCISNTTSGMDPEVLDDGSLFCDGDDLPAPVAPHDAVACAGRVPGPHPVEPSSLKFSTEQTRLYGKLMQCITPPVPPADCNSCFHRSHSGSISSDQAAIPDTQQQQIAARKRRCDQAQAHWERHDEEVVDRLHPPHNQQSVGNHGWNRPSRLPDPVLSFMSAYKAEPNISMTDAVSTEDQCLDVADGSLHDSAMDDLSEFDCGTEIWISIPSRVIDLTIKAMVA